METILAILGGGGLGAIMRYVPEIFKHFDRKNERAHEALMFDKEIELAKHRAEQEMQRIDAGARIESMQLLSTALEGQTRMAEAAGGWVAKLSTAVRPIVTFWQFTLYSIIKTCALLIAVIYSLSDQSAATRIDRLLGVLGAIQGVWTIEDSAMLSMIMSFWFVGRSYERPKSS